MRKKILRAASFTTRWLTYGGVALVLFGAVIYVAGRLWLPGLIGDKARIEQALTRASGQTIQIDRIQPHWDGAFPGIAASGIKVFATDLGQPSIVLDQVRVTMSLLPLLKGRISIHRLVAVRPHIALERLADNRYRVSGFSPVKAKVQKSDDRFVEWLFAQKELSIEDGALQWLDHRAPKAVPRHLKGVYLSLVNTGDRHQLKFNADFPADLCIRCAFEVDVEGNPFQGADWGGRVNIEAVGLDFGGLPHAARSQLPESLRGRFDLRLRTQWVNGKPRVAQGSIDAFGLVVPAFITKEPLPVDRLRGQLRWQGKAGSWRLDVDNVLLGFGGEPWTAGHLRIDHNPETTHARVRHIAVDKLVDYSRYFEMPERVRYYLDGLKPSGSVNDLAIRWDRRPEAESKFFLKTRLSNIAVKNFEKFPGAQGISGYLVLDENAGNFHLTTRRAEMILPHIFREKLSVRSLLGQVHWERKKDRWEISGQDIRVAGDASARGNMLLRLPYDKSISPFLRMRFDFNRVDGRHASKYYPVNRMRPKLIDFLDRSILAGYGVKGHVVFEGETRRFPFRDGSGIFEAKVDIHDAVFQYLEGWTPITGGEVSLLFRGPSMLITAHSGWIDDLAVREVVVRKHDVKDRAIPISVTGRLTGPAESALAVLRASPMASRNDSWKRFLTPGMEAQGPSSLNLQIEVPPGQPKQARIDGEFRLNGSTVDIPVADFRFHKVVGNVGFNQAGIKSGKLRAEFLGEPTKVSIVGTAQTGDARTVFKGKGKATAAGLANHFGVGVRKLLSGDANWDGELTLERGKADLRINSDLGGFRTILPRPYRELALKERQPVLETVVSSRTSHRLRLRLGEDTVGVLDFGSTNDQWMFNGGHISLGAAGVQLPDHDGLHVSLKADKLNGDSWIDLLGDTNAGGSELPDFIKQFSADVDDLNVHGRRIGQFNIDVKRDANAWVGTADGETLSGIVKYSAQDKVNKIELDLDRLRIPKKTRETVAKDVDPRTLPTLGIKARKFQLGSSDFGALDFWASHTDIGWQIQKFNLDKPQLAVQASGNWYHVVGRDSAELDVQIQSKDMGAMLTSLGAHDMMDRGNLNLTMGYRWREDETRPGLANLDGDINFRIGQGSLLNVKQGAARLANVFNLTEVPKEATSDFDQAVEGGFAFNRISGRVAINKGNAYTDAITVDGSRADIVARGRVGLSDRDIDLVADIYPNLRGGLAVATGWLWGPATAAWILAAQELFKKEIAEGTKITYNISGKWKSPKVQRVERRPEPEEQDE